MKRIRDYMAAVAQAAELPVSAAAGLPEITLSGFGEICIDLQRGLLAYSQEEVIVALPNGRVTVTGSALHICRMKERQIVLRGQIEGLRLEREA